MPYTTTPLGPHGAVIELLVGVSEPRRVVLLKHGLPVPPRSRVPAQIDTGTTFSAIDASVLAMLGVGPTNTLPVLTPSTTGTPQPFRWFPVSLGLDLGGAELLIGSAEVMECVFAPEEGIRGMLGREVLQHCLFIYDGRGGTFSLAF